MVHWDRSARVKVVKLYFRTRSIIETQRAFRREFRRKDAPSRNTILACVRKFREEGTVQQSKHEGRRVVRTPETIAAISAAVKRSPKTSTRRLSARTGVSRTSVRSKELDLWPYKIQIVQKLEDSDPAKRLQFSQWLVNKCEVRRLHQLLHHVR
jgi:biotin operon repressor